MNVAPIYLDRLVVEASSRSRAETGYTIRAGHKKHWIDHDLPLALVTKLLGGVTSVAEIRFHGWGDPLANPEILPMLAAAKATGARVVLVTDAGRFTDEHANALVRDGIDTLVFPLAGLTEDTNFRRRGTSLFAVLAAIDRLRTVQAVHQSQLPDIAIRYTLTRSGLAHELEQLPDFLKGIGVGSVAVRPLSYATSAQTALETLVPGDQAAYDELAGRLREIGQRAAAAGIRLESRLVHGGIDRFHCPDTPGSSLFVAADGAISPCPLRNVPVAPGDGYHFHGQDVPFPRDVRGNLHTQDIGAIWNDPAYKDFRYHHDTDTPPQGCAGCWRSFWVAL